MREKAKYPEPILHGHDDDAAVSEPRVDRPACGSRPVGTAMNPHEHRQAGLAIAAAASARRTNVQIEAVLLAAFLLYTVPTNKGLQAGGDPLYCRMSSRLRKEGLGRLPAQWPDRR